MARIMNKQIRKTFSRFSDEEKSGIDFLDRVQAESI